MEIIIGFVVGFFAGRYWPRKQGLRSANAIRQKAKEDSLVKIMSIFDSREEITNDDVESTLGISDATATNYLSELEKQSKIIQIGKEGRGVVYKKK